MSEFITTYTGKHFKPTDPDPELIDIPDIAHALSLICRGNGHVKTFWSVGQHCICCAKEAAARGLSDRMVLACLLHDASEAYLSDVPRPFKKHLPAYKDLEQNLLNVIYTKYLGSPLTEEEERRIKCIDDDMLYFDLLTLLNEPSNRPEPELHINLSYEVRPFENVEQEYLQLFHCINSIYFSSFGKMIFKRIATIAAGTIPDPPNTNCTTSGVCTRIPGLAPIPYPTPSATDTMERFLAFNRFFVIN